VRHGTDPARVEGVVGVGIDALIASRPRVDSFAGAERGHDGVVFLSPHERGPHLIGHQVHRAARSDGPRLRTQTDCATLETSKRCR
jgi:hypothetical protein